MKLLHLAALATLTFGLAGSALAATGGNPSSSMDSSRSAVDAGNDPQARSSDVGGPDPTDTGRYGYGRSTGESPLAFFRRIFRDQQRR